MNLTIQINVGVTPALERLLWALASGPVTPIADAAPETMPLLDEQKEAASAPAPFKITPVAAVETPKPSPAAEAAPQAEHEPMPVDEAPQAEPITDQPEPMPMDIEPTPGAAPVYDKEFLLEVIERTRQRIQGADYKNASGAKAKALHKALTGEFKRIAMALGASIGVNAEKPSDLPETDIRAAFMHSCAELYLDEDGTIKTKSPF